MRGGSYVIAGAPGSGKTILGNQMCFHHVAQGQQAVYVTLLAESHGRMLTHLKRMSFFDARVISQSLHYVSGYPALRTDNLRGLVAMVAKLIKRHRATLLVMDGLARISSFASSSIEFKEFIHELNILLEFTGCTVVLLTDNASEDIGYPARTMVDGLVELRDRMEGLRAVRELVVSKFRGGPFLRGVHFFEIDDDGIRLYPRLEARRAQPSREPAASNKRMSSGVAGLDAMTLGGLAEGTSTLVLGASGTGKTMLVLHFLSAGFTRKEPSLYFGFFESPARLLGKGDQLGLPGVVAENIILLRQLEIDSELRRAVAVIKTRESAHDQKVRELKIGNRGLEVGEPFELRRGRSEGGARVQRGKGEAP